MPLCQCDKCIGIIEEKIYRLKKVAIALFKMQGKLI